MTFYQQSGCAFGIMDHIMQICKCIWLLIHIHSLHVSGSKGTVTIYVLNMHEE